MKGSQLYENGMSREEYLAQCIRQYAAFDYSDPMTTSDEELFGKWEKDQWAIAPLLDYERVKALEKVALAAKSGDYPACKRLIFDYYNQKFDTFHLDAPQRPDEKNFLCLEMQMENFFVRPQYGPWPLDKMLVGKKALWHETDILPAVRPLAAAADRLLTLHLYALKKDGYTAKFHSRKHEENRPFAEVTVNGKKRIYPAVMDTYLCGGKKRRENFGDEKLLLAEESYSSIHQEETADEYTRRAVLKFDFSDLGPEDKITEAVLHLYGWMEKSDNPVASGKEKGSKIVFVLNDPTGNLWDEKELVWQNLDNGGWVCFSYDGTPGYVNQSMLHYFPNLLQYRSSIMAFAHELVFFADCAAADQDDAAVFHILRLLMHKTRQLHCDFTSTEQPTLNVFRVRCIPEIFQKCRFSPYMTPEIFTAILKSVYEHCEAICGADRFHMHRSKIWTQHLKEANIGAIQTSSLLQAAIVFDEFKAAYAPLGQEWERDSWNGGWLQVIRHRYEMCMRSSFLPDGSVTDIPINYIWTNLWNYVEPLAEWGKKFYFDMRKVFTEEMIGKIIAVCEYAARITSPLYGGWQIGDARGYEKKQLNYLQDIAALFPDRVSDHLKYIASEGIDGIPDRETAMVSEDSSRAVIRSDWTKDAVALHFQSNSHLYHTHNDDLSLVLMAYGNYLLADLTRYLYVKTDTISNWQISRAAHNSVLIDGKEPEKAGGSLHPEDRALNSIYDFLHGDSRGYRDHFQERFICFVRPGYFIVTDHVSSLDQEKHSYRQSWHFHPAARPVLENGGIVRTHFDQKANLIVAPAATPGELSHRLETGYYSRAAQQTALENHQYAVYEKEEAGDATFQTLLYPLRPGSRAAVETRVIPCSCPSPDARAMRAVIREAGKEEIQVDYYIRMKGQGEASFGRYHTDGSMALVELECGKIRTLILRNGSYIWDRKEEKMVLQLNKQVKDAGISFVNGAMQMECSDQDAAML